MGRAGAEMEDALLKADFVIFEREMYGQEYVPGPCQLVSDFSFRAYYCSAQFDDGFQWTSIRHFLV